GEPTSSDLSFTDMYAGMANLKIENGMQSAEGSLIGNFYQKNNWQLAALAGFKWWYFKEDLSFDTSSPYISAPLYTFKTTDSFQTKNNFYGALLGFDANWKYNWFYIHMLAQSSFGV